MVVDTTTAFLERMLEQISEGSGLRLTLLYIMAICAEFIALTAGFTESSTIPSAEQAAAAFAEDNDFDDTASRASSAAPTNRRKQPPADQPAAFGSSSCYEKCSSKRQPPAHP